MDNTTIWKLVTHKEALELCMNSSEEAIPCVIIRESGEMITGWKMHYYPCCSFTLGEGSRGGLRVGYKTESEYHYERVDANDKIYVKK